MSAPGLGDHRKRGGDVDAVNARKINSAPACANQTSARCVRDHAPFSSPICNSGTGIWQPAWEQAIAPFSATRKSQGGWTMKTVLPNA